MVEGSTLALLRSGELRVHFIVPSRTRFVEGAGRRLVRVLLTAFALLGSDMTSFFPVLWHHWVFAQFKGKEDEEERKKGKRAPRFSTSWRNPPSLVKRNFKSRK